MRLARSKPLFGLASLWWPAKTETSYHVDGDGVFQAAFLLLEVPQIAVIRSSSCIVFTQLSRSQNATLCAEQPNIVIFSMCTTNPSLSL